MRIKCYLTILIVSCLLVSLYIMAPDYLRHVIVINRDQAPIQRITLTMPDNTYTDTQQSTLSCQGNSTCYQGNRTCSKHHNLVFVKTHKTGTSTTVNILYHFGIANKLNYAVYPYTHQLYSIQAHRLMQLASNESYNIMCQHMVFNKKVIESVMPGDSYYFSLIREPTKAFVSFYIFYNKDRKIQNEAQGSLTLDASINRYLDGIDKKYHIESNTDRYAITNSINSMSYDLGMSQASSTVLTHAKAESYVNELDARFDLIMTLEHLDESLALLRSDLCWEQSDLFYLNRMQSLSNRSHEPLEENTLARLKRYLQPDYVLYDHFKQKLEARIAAQPPSFQTEIEEFKELRKKFEESCLDLSKYVKSTYKTHQHPLSENGSKSLHCSVLTARDVYLTKLISLLQDPYAHRKSKEEKYGYSAQFRDIEAFPRQWKLKQ